MDAITVQASTPIVQAMDQTVDRATGGARTLTEGNTVAMAISALESPVDGLGLLTVVLGMRMANAAARLDDAGREQVADAACQMLLRDFRAALRRLMA